MPDGARVRELFERALDFSPPERAAFLDEQCGDDAELRAYLDRLLAADSGATDEPVAIERPIPAQMIRTELPTSVEGLRIGAFEVRRILGSGGMSTVFEALQDNPRRLVALRRCESACCPRAPGGGSSTSRRSSRD